MSNAAIDQTMETAKAIISQLGGAGRLKAMIGATLTATTSGLQINFKGCKKSNIVTIDLTPDDLYTVTFLKFSSRTYDLKTIKRLEGVYCDSLISIFEEETGLALSL